ncbi:hypothetical protein [Paenibacillus sp. UNC499MF]|uniref:hypothetical protein n=1 Tax=Paenibacillus sp. UNC499MF TaxID=1502751 RepID=UPI0015E20A96|nr:hypothetical protein [Paenibacillus sp. UNC499MF]
MKFRLQGIKAVCLSGRRVLRTLRSRAGADKQCKEEPAAVGRDASEQIRKRSGRHG